jgi:serine/threonine protein phosphatase PrpC
MIFGMRCTTPPLRRARTWKDETMRMQTTFALPDEGMVSHRGQVRQLNEDSYGSFRTVLTEPQQPAQAALLRRKGRLYVVTDGMGGHDSGDVASATAVQQICAAYYADAEDDPEAALRRSISQANTVIYTTAKAQRCPSTRPMGTTVVCAVIRDRQVTIAHVGDSRAYRLRGGALTCLTTDHTWITEQMRVHGLTREEAEQRARQRGAQGVLTRAVGAQPSAEPDLVTLDWCPDDALLLCSDGLHGLIGDSAIARILAAHPAPLAARELVAAANAAGGHDNITALVVRDGEIRAVSGAPWRRKITQLLVLLISVVLLALGLMAPIANGQPIVNAGAVFDLAGVATMAPTATLQPTATWTPTPLLTATPTATNTPTPTSPPPTRAPATQAPSSQAIELQPSSVAQSPTPTIATVTIDGGGPGDLFRGSGYQGATLDGSGAAGGSCIQGQVTTIDGSLFQSFYVQVDQRGATIPAQHFYDTGNYRVCGLSAGEWGVAVYAANTIATTPSEQAKHQVRVGLTGQPGEIVYINFRATARISLPPSVTAPPANEILGPTTAPDQLIPLPHVMTITETPTPEPMPAATSAPEAPTTTPESPTPVEIPQLPTPSTDALPPEPSAVPPTAEPTLPPEPGDP